MGIRQALTEGSLVQVVLDGVVVYKGQADSMGSIDAAEAAAGRPGWWSAAHPNQECADKAKAEVVAKAKAAEKKAAEAGTKVK